MFVYIFVIVKIGIDFSYNLGIMDISFMIPFLNGEGVYNTMYSNVVSINTCIKYDETKYSIEAQKVLKRMFNSLEGEELEFAKQHLLPLLEPLNGDTGLII